MPLNIFSYAVLYNFGVNIFRKTNAGKSGECFIVLIKVLILGGNFVYF